MERDGQEVSKQYERWSLNLRREIADSVSIYSRNIDLSSLTLKSMLQERKRFARRRQATATGVDRNSRFEVVSIAPPLGFNQRHIFKAKPANWVAAIELLVSEVADAT